MTRRLKTWIAVGFLCLFLVIGSMMASRFYIHRRDYQLNIALIEAVGDDDRHAVQVLLARGADPNARLRPQEPPTFLDFCRQMFSMHRPETEESMSALIYASKRANLEIVKMLLDAGADVNARDEHGNTALIWATDNWRGYAGPVIILLAQHGADVNAKATDGTTAWEIAKGNEDPEVMKALQKAAARK